MLYFKVFGNKGNLNRHNKISHKPHVQPPVEEDPRQSGGMNDVGTSQTKFENANSQVDVASQTYFDVQSMIDNDGSDKL